MINQAQTYRIESVFILYLTAIMVSITSDYSHSQELRDRYDHQAAEIEFAEVGHLPHCGKAAAAQRLMNQSPTSISAAYVAAMMDTDVQHNALDIEISNINPAGNTCLINGSNTMTIQSKSASLNEFQFRLRSQYNVTNAYINGAIPVTVTTESASTRLVTLDRAYGMDEVFTLTIEYSGNTVPEVFDSITVTTHSGGIPIVNTLSEPYYAYTWWPAKDGDLRSRGDNSDKATLDFWITVPDNYMVASNGIRQGIDTLSNNRLRYRWASSYPIATYLVSFSVTQYNTWTSNYGYAGGSMPVEFYIYPGLDSSQNRQLWEKVIDMLDTFGQLFGEYPFIEEKYGIYNFPFGGGMEHQTMTGQGSFNESLSAHELAHQWWGDEITCKTWNHIWLNEGFASYSEALWNEFKPGSSGLPALKSTMNSMKYYGPGTVFVSNVEVGNLGEIFNGNTSYDKGAWVLHMLRNVLGDQSFFNALAEYRDTYQYGAATTEEFQSVCEQYYSGGDLDWFFSEWIYGEYAPAYQWGWDTVQIDGENYVLISVDQTQNQTYQRFTMPIDIVIDGNRHVVFNDADQEYFVIPYASIPTTVKFDPDQWILRSSLLEGTYEAGPPTILETTPAPGAFIDVVTNVESISIYFHKSIDAVADNITLTGDDSGPHAFTLASDTNVNPLVLIPVTPLPIDTYTLTITGGIVSSDLGLLLDGEIKNPTDPATFPSGDGQAGGETVIQFTITPPVPAVSQWGLLTSVLLLSIAGTILLHQRRIYG